MRAQLGLVVVAVQDGGLDEVGHGARRLVAQRHGLDDVLAAQHVENAHEEVLGADARPVQVQRALDEDGEGRQPGAQDHPKDRPALCQQLQHGPSAVRPVRRRTSTARP
jgi:hypothetical protein